MELGEEMGLLGVLRLIPQGQAFSPVKAGAGSTGMHREGKASHRLAQVIASPWGRSSGGWKHTPLGSGPSQSGLTPSYVAASSPGPLGLPWG